MILCSESILVSHILIYWHSAMAEILNAFDSYNIKCLLSLRSVFFAGDLDPDEIRAGAAHVELMGS